MLTSSVDELVAPDTTSGSTILLAVNVSTTDFPSLLVSSAGTTAPGPLEGIITPPSLFASAVGKPPLSLTEGVIPASLIVPVGSVSLVDVASATDLVARKTLSSAGGSLVERSAIASLSSLVSSASSDLKNYKRKEQEEVSKGERGKVVCEQ